VKLLAAAVLAAAALIVAVVVFTGGGGGGFPSAEEERLLSLIPAPVRDSCARTREMPNALAAVSCRAQRQAVSYFHFGGTAPMSREYARRATQYLSAGLRRDVGACGELPRIGERSYTAGGRRAGRIFCAPGGNSVFIGWTDERASVFALASRADEDPAALYRWWQRAGRQPRTSDVPSGALLYHEAFSSGNGDWARPDTRLASYAYSGGRYLIAVRQPGSVIPVTTANAIPPLSFGDVRLEAIATRVGGQRNYGFGLVCRSGKGALYTLQVRSDGLTLIRKRSGSRPPVELAKPKSLGRGALRAGRNRIGATCTGGSGRVRLTLSLNGRQVLTAEDRNPIASTGAVGLLASSLDRGGVSIAFDDFRVRKA
jgi:hypothetical protein